MNKITALHKRAAFLRKAEAAALTLWREPNWPDIRPAIIEVRYKREKQIAKYWANALGSQASEGLTNSLRGRTFLVIDETSRCLIGLLAYKTAPKKAEPRDTLIGWAGEWRERRAAHVIELIRCLPSEPFVTLGGMRLLMQIAASTEIVSLLETRASVPFAALVFTTRADDAARNDLPSVKDFEPPWFTQATDPIRLTATYIADLRMNAGAYLRGEAATLDVETATRPFREICEGWQRTALRKLVADKVTPWDQDAYCYARLIERFDRGTDGSRHD